MKLTGEIPVCTRCCFCFPLRYGLIVWAFIKLIAVAFIILAISMSLDDMIYRLNKHVTYRVNTVDIIIASIALIISISDFILTLVFIIGGHKKNVKLMRVFYIYNIVLWALTVLLVIFAAIVSIRFMIMWNKMSVFVWMMALLDLAAYFSFIVAQSYFILLLRSEIIKLRNQCKYRFVNNAAEAECDMRHEETHNNDVVQNSKTEEV